MFNKTINRIKVNPLGTAVGMVGGYYVAKRYIVAPSTLLTVILVGLGGIGGSIIESKIKAYKSMPNKGDVQLTALTREQLQQMRSK